MIASGDGLHDLVADLISEPLLAIDTEFERRSTYYPKLALVQIATRDAAWLIDPLEIDDWSPLRTLLASPSLKVLHSASEDLEVLRHAVGEVPRPLFDTQVACAFLGEGPSLGYAAMLQNLCGIDLDKSQTRSDWMRRPLSSAQLHYAEQDVIWLPQIHDRLQERLVAAGKREWFSEECQQLVERGRFENDPEDAANRFRLRGHWSPEKLARLRKLAAWRELIARVEDRPRTWIVPDAVVIELAERVPESPAALSRLEIHPRILRKYGNEIVELMQTTSAQVLHQETGITPFEAGDRERLKRLQARIGELAEQLEIDASLLARRNDLESLLREERNGLARARLLEGWRGELLEPILAGEGV